MSVHLKQVPILCPNCGEHLYEVLVGTKREDPLCVRCHPRRFTQMAPHATIEVLKPSQRLKTPGVNPDGTRAR